LVTAAADEPRLPAPNNYTDFIKTRWLNKKSSGLVYWMTPN